MNRKINVEFAYQIFALITAIVIVHGMYTLVIRPKAEVIRQQQIEQLAVDENYEPERSPYILVKDLEQEICFILMFWAIAIMAFKAVMISREGRLLEKNLIPLSEGVSILPEDTRSYSRTVQELPDNERRLLLPRVLLSALHRFRTTRNIQDVSTVVSNLCESESDRLDSELSLVRYIAWAIPSIGFIGTVRGIGEALGKAHQAVEGDITGVTASLGVAFNSTFIALLLSIILMFLLHQLTLVLDRLVQDTQDYCDQRLVSQLQVR